MAPAKGNTHAAGNRGNPAPLPGPGRPSSPARTLLRLIAWQRYGRPTTRAEEQQVLLALIIEEAERIKKE